MRMKETFLLLSLLAVPVAVSAQAMDHDHHQGQQQMPQMEKMQQMVQQMSQMHEELLGLQGHMDQMMVKGAQQAHHSQIKGVTEAMGQMAGQMHLAMVRMMEIAGGEAMHQDPAMHQDMEQWQEHMQKMTDGMEASLEVMRRMHTRSSEGGGGR